MPTVTISSPKFQLIEIPIVGTTPYCQNKMSRSAFQKMRNNMLLGSQAGSSKKKKEPRNFDRDYDETIRRTESGDYGIPAPALRQSMVRACDMVGFKMTRAKMSIFVLADGYDKDDGMPLVRLVGKPTKMEHVVTNATGVPDIRTRPFWPIGWRAKVRIRYDADQFSAEDVTNLLARAGAQVGIGAGRAFSPNSAGMGWGEFEIETDKPSKKSRG